MFVTALLGLFVVLGVAPPAERPRPWLGFGKDGGLIITAQEARVDVPRDLDTADDISAFEEAEIAKWLGAAPQVVAVDSRPAKSFYVEATSSKDKVVVGERFEVFGAAGRVCTVEVTHAVRAVLRFTGQFWTYKELADTVYRGPGERVPPTQVGASTLVVTPDELTSSYPYGSPRFRGLVAKPVTGDCPVDGLVGPVGQFAVLPMRVGEPALADAVRKDFRASKSIVELERDYRAALAEVGARGLDCEGLVPPEHLDTFATGMRTTVFEAAEQAPLLLAMTGSATNPCDPARAAIVYRKKAAGWARARELWGQHTAPITIEFAVRDVKTTRAWIAGPSERPGADGWEWTVTALDKAGLGTKFGGWPNNDAHYCNYGDTHWEFAHICRLPGE